MHIVQLMASPFLGGPERQMLGLSQALPREYRTTFLSFAEHGRCRPLLEEVRRNGMEAIQLEHNFPRLGRCVREVKSRLKQLGADVVCCSGYKPDLIGLAAARRAGIPAISISHGWTAATWRVRVYEALDRLALRWMDAVVCVSEAQAAKVRRAGVSPERTQVIRNAVAPERFKKSELNYRQELESFFPERPRYIVGAAGRLSPEKGFERLIEAAAQVVKEKLSVAFVIFGEGPCRLELQRRIKELGLGKNVVLPGFRGDMEAYLPHFDLLALSSYTEGLPVILLESMACGVPAVATAVGGVPEVIEDGISGRLVEAGNKAALAERIIQLLDDEAQRQAMGQAGKKRVEEHFTFASQSEAYQELFKRLTASRNEGVVEETLRGLANASH